MELHGGHFSSPWRNAYVLLLVGLLPLSVGAEGRWLGGIGRGRLVADLSHPSDARIRERAARALGRERSVHAVDPLVARLPIEESARVREAIADALGALGDRRAVPILIRVLERRGDPARVAAARALGRIRDPEAVDSLARAAGDTSTERVALEALGRIGDRAIPIALAMLRDPARGVAGARALGATKDPRALPALLGALHSPVPELRRAAAAAIGALDDERATWALREAGRDVDPVVRTLAAESLDRIAPPAAEVVPVLPIRRSTLKDVGLQLRPRPSIAFVPPVPPRLSSLVTSQLRSRDRDRIEDALFAAGFLRQSEGARTMERLLRQTSHSVLVRRAAAFALGRLRRSESLRRAADRERVVEVRAAIAQALGEAADPGSVPALVRMVRRRDDASPGAVTALAVLRADSALPDLRRALDAPSAALRAAAAASLARFGDTPSAAQLRYLAEEDPSESVRRVASLAPGPVPRGISLLRARAPDAAPGRRAVVVTPEGRVDVVWTDRNGEIVLVDVTRGVGRVEWDGGSVEALPTE